MTDLHIHEIKRWSPILVEVQPFRDAKREFERLYVTQVLELTHGNVSEAARVAGKDRKDMYDLIRRAGLRAQDFRK